MVIFSYDRHDCVISHANNCKHINRGINPTGQRSCRCRVKFSTQSDQPCSYLSLYFTFDRGKVEVTHVHHRVRLCLKVERGLGDVGRGDAGTRGRGDVTSGT